MNNYKITITGDDLPEPVELEGRGYFVSTHSVEANECDSAVGGEWTPAAIACVVSDFLNKLSPKAAQFVLAAVKQTVHPTATDAKSSAGTPS